MNIIYCMCGSCPPDCQIRLTFAIPNWDLTLECGWWLVSECSKQYRPSGGYV